VVLQNLDFIVIDEVIEKGIEIDCEGDKEYNKDKERWNSFPHRIQ
jgi:hypothetical protein